MGKNGIVCLFVQLCRCYCSFFCIIYCLSFLCLCLNKDSPIFFLVCLLLLFLLSIFLVCQFLTIDASCLYRCVLFVSFVSYILTFLPCVLFNIFIISCPFVCLLPSLFYYVLSFLFKFIKHFLPIAIFAPLLLSSPHSLSQIGNIKVTVKSNRFSLFSF